MATIVETKSMNGESAKWDGERIVEGFDWATGARFLAFVHSTALGPGCGGTRMRVYPSLADAVTDGKRLSAGMTRKLAVAGLPFGGGKAVIAVSELPTGAARRAMFEKYGDFIDTLGGEFLTGIDMNTTEADMDVAGARSPYIFCRSAKNGGSGDSSPATALGILHGIRATLEHAFGSGDLTDRTALVQGVGGVGGRLAELLAEEGARVSVSDIDMDRATALAGRLGAGLVAPDAVIGAEVDVYAPCAIGGVLNEQSIPRLRCRVVAGAANNQLWETKDADRLRDAGILYAPDYVINAGGALYALGLELLGWSHAELSRRIEGIADTLRSVFDRAGSRGITTAAAAEEMAAEALYRSPALALTASA